MKLIVIIPIIYSIAKTQSKPCVELTSEIDKLCQSTNHETYMECLRKHRSKRSSDCNEHNEVSYESCDSCDCNTCRYSQCKDVCNNCCSSCCDKFVPCNTKHCCHKTCHAECRTKVCRASCRESCYHNISHPVNVTSPTGTASNASVGSNIINNNLPNVTTIIHLHNTVNNTNVVGVPINLEYTNKNNISIAGENESGNGTGGNCCTVIGPRQCHPTSTFPFVKCFHTRARQCDWYCTASIVHEEEQEICQRDIFGQPINCKQEKAYIPQPQPRCIYTSVWPYVWCGIQKPTSCEGCYNRESMVYNNCSPQCYDDGFGVGPYYRQGPYYQPSFSHVPCPYLPNGCERFSGYGNTEGFGAYPGYGGYEGAPAYGGYGLQGGLSGAVGFNPPYGYSSQMSVPTGSFSEGLPLGPPVPLGFENNQNLSESSNKTGLLNPTIDTIRSIGKMHLPYDLPDKEVEIEVTIVNAETEATNLRAEP